MWRITQEDPCKSDSDLFVAYDIVISSSDAIASYSSDKKSAIADSFAWLDTYVSGRSIEFSGSSGFVSNPGNEPILYFNMVMNSTICDFTIHKTNAGIILKYQIQTSA